MNSWRREELDGIQASDSSKRKPDTHRRHRYPTKRGEADFRVFRNRPFAAKPKNWETAAQVWISSFSAAGPLSSVIGPSLLTVLEDKEISKHRDSL